MTSPRDIEIQIATYRGCYCRSLYGLFILFSSKISSLKEDGESGYLCPGWSASDVADFSRFAADRIFPYFFRPRRGSRAIAAIALGRSEARRGRRFAGGGEAVAALRQVGLVFLISRPRRKRCSQATALRSCFL